MFGKGKKENAHKTPSLADTKGICIIAHGTTIEGKVTIKNNMRLDGHIIGDIISDGGIVMSAQASIKGNILCQYIVTEGYIDGNITAHKKVHLKSTAKIKGNIKYKSIQIDEGAIMNGQITSIGNDNTPAAASKKKS